MSVERLHSVAVVDHDIVAPTAVPAVTGVYDLTTICGIDRASVACTDVGATVVLVFTGDGVSAGALTTRYIGTAGGPNKTTGSDIAAATPSGAAAVGLIGFFLSPLLLVELLYLGLNLRLKCGLLTVKSAEYGCVLVDVGLQGSDDCRSLSDVDLKLILELCTLGLVLLELGLCFLVLGLDRLKIGDRLLVRFLKLLVALHYIADVINKA